MKNILIVVSFVLSLTLVAQDVNFSSKDEFKKAKLLIQFEKNSEALVHIDKLLTKHDNSNYNYLKGKCLLNIESERSKSLKYLIKANKQVSKDYKNIYNYTAAPPEAVFLLAQSYYYNYKFHKALALINKYKKIVGSANEDKNVIQFEKRCINALKIYNHPIKIESKNLGDNINSNLNEFLPLLNSKETILVYTINDFNSNITSIYISHKKDDKWEKAESISPNINNFGSVVAVALSSDGNQLILRRDDGGVYNLYISKFIGSWSVPEKLNNNINSKYNEINAAFTNNGDGLYFVSDRKGGFGGYDIYFSKLMPNGEWGKAQNLGDKINSEYNENAMQIKNGGYTLFFSSDNPNSLGGYDLYFSDLINENNWGSPINMGYPLNTVENNINFYITKDLKTAYTSYRNNEAGLDLYKVNLLSSPKRTSVVIKGYIRDKKGNIIKDETINLHERRSTKYIGSYTPNEDGEYTFILSEGLKYFISFDDETKIFSPKIISVPESASFYDIGKPVNVETITVIQ